jgi:O-antigen/teichoic acid export membrane protein
VKARLEKLMPKSRFARGVFTLAGGTAGGQLIVIAASPVLTRLYTPEDFGLLAVYAGILGILVVIASFRYELAIPLPKTDKKALNVVMLSLLVLTILTFGLAFVVWVFGSDLIALLNTPDLGPYLWLLPVGFAFVGLYQILQYWSLRVKSFALIAKTKKVQSTFVAGLQIAGSSLGPLALLGSRAIGHVIIDAMLLKGMKLSGKIIKDNVSTEEIISVAKQYRQFPIFSSWAGLLNASGAQIPTLFFAALFGPAAAGGYMLAQRVINMPLSVIGTAVSDAFLPSSIDALREKKLGNHVTKLFSALAGLIFPCATLLFFVAPDLFHIAFGDDWRVAGEIVRWLTPMLAIQFLINPVSRIFVTVERQDLALFFQACLFGLRAGSLLIAYMSEFSLIEAVQLFSFASMLGYALYFFAICNVTNLTLVDLAPLIYRIFLPSVALGAGGYLLYHIHDGYLSHFIFFGACFILIYLNIKTFNTFFKTK